MLKKNLNFCLFWLDPQQSFVFLFRDYYQVHQVLGSPKLERKLLKNIYLDKTEIFGNFNNFQNAYLS